MSEDILKTVVFTSLPAVFGAGPLGLEKALGWVIIVPASGVLSRSSKLVPRIPSRTGHVWIIGISVLRVMQFDSSVSIELLTEVS